MCQSRLGGVRGCARGERGCESESERLREEEKEEKRVERSPGTRVT